MKTFLHFLALLVVAAALLAASTVIARAEGGSCCREESAAEAPSVTGLSLYQFGAAFENDAGAAVHLADFRGRKVLLAMFYARCKTACPRLLADVSQFLANLPREGRPLVVLVSLDPERDSVAALADFRRSRQLDTNFVLLRTGASDTRALAAMLGVNYRPEPDGGVAHSNVLTCLNEEGERVHVRAGLSGGHEEMAKALGL